MIRNVINTAIPIMLFVPFSYSQRCIGDYPTYYASTLVFLYQNMDSESAIIGQIPKGSSVKVIDSFFGKTNGFWQVCYNGQFGYAKKDELSYTIIGESKSVTRNKHVDDVKANDESDEEDIGFSPFLGTSTSSVNMRSGPSVNYPSLGIIPVSTAVYVYSKKSVNGFYKIIDISSNNIGWVSERYVKYKGNVDVNSTGAFQSTGYSATYNSQITVVNDSYKSIKLTIGDEVFQLKPNSKTNIEVEPGRKYYIASAPGVIPASGYQQFESNNGYDWRFWIETSRH